MRLGQLARKLALRPAEIVQILAGHQILVAEDHNVKLDKAQMILVLQRFPPELQKEILNEDKVVEEVKAPEQPLIEEAPVEAQLVTEEISLPVASNESPVEKPEVIKAPKVELSGLKVLGKIEIPEPKKKTAEPAPEGENVSSEVTENKPERRERPARPSRGTQRPVKNPIAREREREAREAQQKKEEEARIQKEKRTQNYLKKVKTPQPTKAVRLVKEDVMEMSAAELREPPKTWWGKFVRWLTT